MYIYVYVYISLSLYVYIYIYIYISTGFLYGVLSLVPGRLAAARRASPGGWLGLLYRYTHEGAGFSTLDRGLSC